MCKMFEEFEGKDNNFYVDDEEVFRVMLVGLPVEETGVSFSGEIDIDDKTSVLIDKQVKMDNPEESIKTYHKVIEMRDLSEAEIKGISKFRLFFNKLYEVFFRKQKFRVFITLYWLAFLSLEIAQEDYLFSLIYVAAIALYNSPIKFAREMKKIFASGKRKEELKEELTKLNVMNLVNTVPDDDGIMLYFKPKAPSM